MVLRYCIRTCPQRKDVFEKLFANLRDHLPENIEIDVVNDDIGRSAIIVFGRYIKDLLEKKIAFDYLVVLEDDALMNDHLHYNISTWDALTYENFGLAHLATPSILYFLRVNDTDFDQDICEYLRRSRLHYSACQIFSKSFLGKLNIDEMLSRGGKGYDIYISEHCLNLGFDFYLHYPSLVASQPIKSSLGNDHYVPLDDAFSKDWKRGVKDDAYAKMKNMERLYRTRL